MLGAAFDAVMRLLEVAGGEDRDRLLLVAKSLSRASADLASLSKGGRAASPTLDQGAAACQVGVERRHGPH